MNKNDYHGSWIVQQINWRPQCHVKFYDAEGETLIADEKFKQEKKLENKHLETAFSTKIFF